MLNNTFCGKIKQYRRKSVSEPYKKVGDNQWILTVQENGKDQELFVQFPEEAINQMGWSEGDTLEWLDNGDGSWTIQQKNQ
jgi:hypothetical protein